ncbi:phage tail protein [Escherichia coli]|uniref:phage tail protein n=1 Tax=Escherichia coli TaxID=562 RepID=UPI003F499646
MGEGSALPVGVPVPWPLWLKCNGAAFSSEMYPKLAKAYPTNKLPDLRGEFIRGWDDGRGIGRTLLSGQDGDFSHYGGNFDIGSGHSINNYDQIATGWLKCNGAAFSSEKYPNLAKAYPPINYRIYGENLFAAGMMGAGWMRDVLY